MLLQWLSNKQTNTRVDTYIQEEEEKPIITIMKRPEAIPQGPFFSYLLYASSYILYRCCCCVMYTVVEVFFSIWMDMRVQQLGFLIFFNFISPRCCLVHSRGFLELWWEEKPPLQNQMKRVKYSIMNHLLYMPSSKYLLSRRGRRILEPSAHHQRERRETTWICFSIIHYISRELRRRRTTYQAAASS